MKKSGSLIVFILTFAEVLFVSLFMYHAIGLEDRGVNIDSYSVAAIGFAAV